MMASQKSGTLAAVIERNDANRSASEFGRYAAHEPITTARRAAMTMVVIASWSVAGKARNAIAAADSPVLSEVPKSRCRMPWR